MKFLLFTIIIFSVVLHVILVCLGLCQDISHCVFDKYPNLSSCGAVGAEKTHCGIRSKIHTFFSLLDAIRLRRCYKFTSFWSRWKDDILRMPYFKCLRHHAILHGNNRLQDDEYKMIRTLRCRYYAQVQSYIYILCVGERTTRCWWINSNRAPLAFAPRNK